MVIQETPFLPMMMIPYCPNGIFTMHYPWPADAGSSLGVPNEPEAQAQLQPGKHRSHWIGGKIYRKPMVFSYEMDIFLLFFP